jgi:4-amino-4-deoxy-L-arabinose transferase
MPRTTTWLLAMLLVLAFAFQGTRGIWEPDEGRYTSAGVNMLESGDWLVPTIDGEHPHLTKPPVTYWLLASSFGALGHNEWAARLPGALAFVGTGLLVFGIGRRLLPAKPWLPASIWALGLAPVIAANVISTDNVLVFFETAAMFAFVTAWHGRGELHRGWICAMWALWGLAFLTKGPPGLLPLFAVTAFLAFHERRSLRSLFDPLGLLVFAVVAFTWFGVLIAQDPERLGYFLGYEVYDRVFTTKHDRNSQWYGALEVYLPVLLAGALPWWVLSIAAAGGPRGAWQAFRARIGARDRDWLLLAWWFVLPLAVFCLARSRLQLYVLPLFVPLALMLARPLAAWPWLTDRRLLGISATTAIVLLVTKATLAYWPSDRDARSMSRAVAGFLPADGVDGIVFVGMKPFYGLKLYLDTGIEGVHMGERAIEYSRFLSEEDLCAELDTAERNVYLMKATREEKFVTAVKHCAGIEPRRLGEFEADDNRMVLVAVGARDQKR